MQMKKYATCLKVHTFCILGLDLDAVDDDGRIIDGDTGKMLFDISGFREKLVSQMDDIGLAKEILKHPTFYDDISVLHYTRDKWRQVIPDLPEELTIEDTHGWLIGMPIECIGEDETLRQFKHRVCLALQKLGYLGEENAIQILEDTDE